MRPARYKKIPRKNKHVPYGIARQRELIDLVERRFAQADLIRRAVDRAKGLSFLTEEETSAEERDAASAIPTASAESTACPDAPADSNTCPDAPADSIACPDASAESNTCPDAPAEADAPADFPSETKVASASPSEPKAESASEPSSASASPSASETKAESPSASPSASEADSDAPLHSVTLVWHGQTETVTHPEVWLRIFADVSDAGDAITRELVRRRFCNEPYWQTCDALYISHSAYYQNLREILHYTLACAVGYGILDPRPKHPAERP